MPITYQQLERDYLQAVGKLEGIYQVVEKQAEDDGLWFVAKTAPEAYLQQELRRLHTVIEEDENGN